MRVELDLHRWVFLFAQIAKLYCAIWMFPNIGVPQNGWFIMEMDDLGVPLFLERPIFLGVPTSIYFS